MFSRRPSGGADFILLFTPGNLFGNERRAGCGTAGGYVAEGGGITTVRDTMPRLTDNSDDHPAIILISANLLVALDNS